MSAVFRSKVPMESGPRNRDLAERSHDLICTHDLQGRLLSVNTAPARALGYEVEELLQISMRDLIAPEFRASFDAYLLRLRTEGVASGFMTVLTRTGERRTWEFYNTLEDTDPPVVRGIAHDVTERIRAERALRESEERLRLATQVGRMYAYEWDAATDVVVRSAQVTNFLCSGGEPVRTTRQQLLAKVHPDDRAKFIASVAERTPEDPTSRISYRMLQPDGSIVWVEKTARAFFDSNGKLLRMIGIVADITERKLAEEVLSTVSRRLIDAQETERTRIARDLHDHIGQQLTLLGIALEKLKRSLPTSLTEARKRAKAAQKQVADLSCDVHSLSHELHSFKLEYLGMVAAMKSFCEELAEQQNVEIDFSDKRIPNTVPQQISLCLFRVLQEALNNAAKHSGVRHFEVELLGTPEALDLVVRDDGRGFDLAAAMQGRGLGLTSMQERLKLVDGELTITSQLKRGTTIRARVPFSAMQNQVAAAG
jgi:PAS domain S-box-containing protein